MDINLVSCGGQSAIPIAYAIMKAQPDTQYIEIASTISSKSAGPGTRINLDEYVQNTKVALEKFPGIRKSKVILSLNPAEPPINMHNTIYALTDGEPDIVKIKASVADMVSRMRQFTPGVRIREGPVYENERLTVISEVIGAGDFLPQYAGNLDVITCASIAVAEGYARKKFGKK
jgi:acetaldehyde dehydrogenase